MNDIIRLEPDDDRDPCVPVLPAPRLSGVLPGEAISIRAAVLDDFPFIDALQKQHSKAVGFMFAGAIKGHIEKGNVLVAEATQGIGSRESGIGQDKGEDAVAPGSEASPYCQFPSPSLPGAAAPVG